MDLDLLLRLAVLAGSVECTVAQPSALRFRLADQFDYVAESSLAVLVFRSVLSGMAFKVTSLIHPSFWEPVAIAEDRVQALADKLVFKKADLDSGPQEFGEYEILDDGGREGWSDEEIKLLVARGRLQDQHFAAKGIRPLNPYGFSADVVVPDDSGMPVELHIETRNDKRTPLYLSIRRTGGAPS